MAEILRGRQYLLTLGRNSESHGSAVRCVESSGNPAKFQLVADPPPGRFCDEGAIFMGIPPDRPTFSGSANYFGRQGGSPHLMIPRAIVGIYLHGIVGEFRLFAEPPTGFCCGEWGEIQRNSARSAEIQRTRHLNGAKGRNSAPHDSSADCVEISPGSPETSRLFADPPTGRFCGEGARFSEIPPDLPKFSEISTYLG